MKNIKTILIAVLSFMLLFSVSCKNEDKTGGGGSGGVRPKLDGAVGDLALLKKELHVPDTAEFPTKKSI